jgi:hypothetical protein
MPCEDVRIEMSNLAELCVALSRETDALSLLAAFEVETLADARQTLRQVAADWGASANRPGTAEPPACAVGS